jgi:hypothetical protein
MRREGYKRKLFLWGSDGTDDISKAQVESGLVHATQHRRVISYG